MRAATAAGVRSSRRSTAGSISTRISSSRAPKNVTRSIPAASNSSRIRLAWRFSTASEYGPDSTSRVIVSYRTIRRTTGRSLSSGRMVTCCSAASASDSADCMSVSASYSTTTRPTPSVA